MKVQKYLLRSLGYLGLPDIFKKKFGINSKKKDRLRMFPEPYDVTVEEDQEFTIITYKWRNRELERYVNRVKSGVVADE